ncbi:MAG TPA: ABC transporter substrate-binding protein [Chloroflexota bacterium]|nr:ABC transporter substrate-binding protein [Chloroflexota bacterium]
MQALSRRSFLGGSIAFTTMLLAGCGGGAAPSAAPASPSTASPAGSAAAKPSSAGSAAASPAVSAKPSAPGTANAVNAAWVAITANQMIWPLAVDAGYFDKYGVNFKLQYVQGSVKSVQALVAGDLQMTQVAGSAVVAAQATKQDLVMTMGFLNQTVWRIMANSDIQSVNDLKGKTVAVTQLGNADYFAWTLLAQKQGWTPQDFKFTAGGDTNGEITLLQNKQVQAIAVSPPSEVASEKLGAHLVLDEASFHQPEQQVGMALSKAYLAKNHDTALNVAKATVEAIHRWKTDPAFAKKVIAKYLKQDDQAYVDDGYSAYAPLFPEVPYPTVEGFKDTIEQVSTQQPAAKNVTPEQCIDNSLVKELEDSGFIKQIYGSSAGASGAAASGAGAASAKPAASGAGAASAAAKPAASGAPSAKPAASS